MSLTSSYKQDYSAELAKRYADITSTYIDSQPENLSEPELIPLENLFRILEMYRYDAFSDEPRAGVLSLDGLPSHNSPSVESKSWHKLIRGAVEKGLHNAFGEADHDGAISELEACLSDVAMNKHLSEDKSVVIKKFLAEFGNYLA